MTVSTVKKSGMIWGCKNIDDCGTRIASHTFVQNPLYKASSVIRRPVLCACTGGEKNGLRCLRLYRARVVRPQTTLGSGFSVWRLSYLLGDRGASYRLPTVHKSEAREAGVAGGQSVLQQTVCFLCGTALRVMTIKDVAQETHLDWKTVKELDKQYMREQLRSRHSSSQGHWG